MRTIKFNAWIPDLEIMLTDVTVYGTGLMGIGCDELEAAVKAKNKDWQICDDGIYLADEDHFDRLMTILCGDDWYWIEEFDFIPLQFTGMTDGDKADIIEGDILVWTPRKPELLYTMMKGADFLSNNGAMYSLAFIPVIHVIKRLVIFIRIRNF
jgi:hypothetical protein